MKRVLIPIDGSACALRAVQLVIGKRLLYAQPEGLEVHLVNVQPTLHVDESRFDIPKPQLAEYQLHESQREMREACQLLEAAGVPCVTHCLVGVPAEEIIQLAAKLDCDQIVMGTRGRNALEALLIGSTTHKVIHRATVPVLLVK